MDELVPYHGTHDGAVIDRDLDAIDAAYNNAAGDHSSSFGGSAALPGFNLSGNNSPYYASDTEFDDPSYIVPSNSLIIYSRAKAEVMNARASVAPINLFRPVNTTGSTIPAGTFFFLGGSLFRATADIADNASITIGTNCEEVSEGGLNRLLSIINSDVPKMFTVTVAKSSSTTFNLSDGFRGMIITTGHDNASNKVNGSVTVVNVASSGAVDLMPINTTNNVSVSSSANNKLTIANSAGTYGAICNFLVFNGTVSVST